MTILSRIRSSPSPCTTYTCTKSEGAVLKVPPASQHLDDYSIWRLVCVPNMTNLCASAAVNLVPKIRLQQQSYCILLCCNNNNAIVVRFVVVRNVGCELSWCELSVSLLWLHKYYHILTIHGTGESRSVVSTVLRSSRPSLSNITSPELYLAITG